MSGAAYVRNSRTRTRTNASNATRWRWRGKRRHRSTNTHPNTRKQARRTAVVSFFSAAGRPWAAPDSFPRLKLSIERGPSFFFHVLDGSCSRLAAGTLWYAFRPWSRSILHGSLHTNDATKHAINPSDPRHRTGYSFIRMTCSGSFADVYHSDWFSEATTTQRSRQLQPPLLPAATTPSPSIASTNSTAKLAVVRQPSQLGARAMGPDAPLSPGGTRWPPPAGLAPTAWGPRTSSRFAAFAPARGLQRPACARSLCSRQG